MEKFPVAQYTFRQIEYAFHAEANLLSKAAQSKRFEIILDRFSDYNQFLSTVASGEEAYKIIQNISGGSNIINSVLDNLAIRDAIYTSHIAACCSLFRQSNFLPEQLRKNKLLPIINNMLSKHQTAESNTLLNFAAGFHILDSVRTMQILRCLGLVSVETKNIDLLGLGAGGGDKEVWTMHMIPSINKISITAPSKRIDDKYALMFNMETGYINSAAIIDSDPQQKDKFKQLEKIERPQVVCFNSYNDAALEALPDTLTNMNMKLRNVITAIRFDHRMFPDVSIFLDKIRPSMADEADLILSIGSGQTFAEFEGRTKKMKEFFDTLSRLGMKPVLIKLHKKGDLRKQWDNPEFGLHGITTYEILYCRLIKEAIL